MDKAELFYSYKFTNPIEEVFEAFSKIEVFEKWFAPRNVETVSVNGDFKVGGQFKATFRKVDKSEFSITGIYQKIEKFHEIIFTFNYEGVSQSFGTSTVYINFQKIGEVTEIKLRQIFSTRPADIDKRIESWKYMINNLNQILIK